MIFWLSSLYPLFLKDQVNFFQKVLDFIASINEQIKVYINAMSMQVKLLSNFASSLVGAFTVPNYMSVAVPPVVSTVCALGVIVALAAIILPGTLGGKK